jgi:hypothetical protein
MKHITGKRLTEKYDIAYIDLPSYVLNGLLDPLGADGNPLPPPDVEQCEKLIRAKKQELRALVEPERMFRIDKSGNWRLRDGFSTSNVELAIRLEKEQVSKVEACRNALHKEIKSLEDHLRFCETSRGDINSWRGFSFDALPSLLTFTKQDQIKKFSVLSSENVFFRCDEVEHVFGLPSGKNEHKRNTTDISIETPTGTTWGAIGLVIRNNGLTEILEVNGPGGFKSNYNPAELGLCGHQGRGGVLWTFLVMPS